MKLDLNLKAVNVSIGDEFSIIEMTFDGVKKARIVVPTDTAERPETYLVNSQDVSANHALRQRARILIGYMADEEKPGDGGR